MITHRLRTPLLLLILFLATWLPRVLALDAFVTYDERKWLARSANFYQAITHEDWTHTFQREHPGVTVMWAGVLGFLQRFPDYPQQAPGQFTWEREHFEDWLHQHSQLTPLTMLAAGRWWEVLFITLAIVSSYFPLRRLFGGKIAALAVLFIAWDPFDVALSRQLHPDGLVAGLISLALLLFLAWLYGTKSTQNGAETPAKKYQWRYLIASGIVMGLAWLTKTPSIFLVPTGAILIALEVWRNRQTKISSLQSPVSNLLLGYVLWGIIATLIFAALWPSIWVHPIGTLRQMTATMEDYAEGHVNGNYFLGQPTDEPGALFYPVAYLFRSTPAIVLGLLAALWAAWRRAKPFDQPHTRRAALALLLFALIFGIGMSIGAKQFDRYILPVFPALDVLAILGWVYLAQVLVNWWSKSRLVNTPISLPSSALSLLIGVTFLLHGLLGFWQYPYYFTYFNPLTGGSWTAPRVLFVGWGEGLDEAGRWLNQQPDAQKLRVVAWYADGPLSYFFKGQASGLSYGSPLFWLDTDYAITYANQWQRQIPDAATIAYFAAQKPVQVIRFRGLELARIYDMRDALLPDFVDIGKASAADFGGKIRLAAYKFEQQTAKPGDHFQATFYLQSLAKMDVNYNVLVRLVGQDGSELWREEGWPWGAATQDWPLRDIRPDGHKVLIPANAKPGLYKFLISFYDPATLTNLPVTVAKSDKVIDAQTRDVALLRIGEPPAVQQALPQPWQFDRFFALSGVTVPAQAKPGSNLNLSLQWDSVQRANLDYTTFVHVVNADGKLVAQQDRPPLGGFAATRLWEPGQRVVDDYAIPLPSDLSTGKYTVQVGLYNPGNGARLPVAQNGKAAGDFVAIGAFAVP
ncbi:MAG: glycosyltransferase family 39 protein [Caldilineaceae bacterium]